MAKMTISLSDERKAFVEDQAAKKGFGTVSEIRAGDDPGNPAAAGPVRAVG
jgi:hypothetical protein